MKESASIFPDKAGHFSLSDINAFPKMTAINHLHSGFVSPLTEQGILQLSGDDAIHFIHGQLSNDIEHLGPSEARLAGYCTPKGRLLASFLVWISDRSVYLSAPREIVSAFQKRIQMYILRAKVRISDVSDHYLLLGLGGKSAAESLNRWFSVLPSELYGKKEGQFGCLIRVSDAFGVPRYLWAINSDLVHTAWATLVSELHVVHENNWSLCNIEAGIPQITGATQDQFVPQMVNLDMVGGVSFKKGCYPGQEVVARTKYLGKVRRRMLPAYIEMPEDSSAESLGIQAGAAVYADSDPDQPCGVLVNIAQRDASRVDCLLVVHADFLSAKHVYVGSTGGPLLHFSSLPYELPDDFQSPGV